MFESLFKSKHQPIGLDIGHSVIKMIQLSRSDNTIRVQAAEEQTIDRSLEPGSDAWRVQVAEALAAMRQQGAFHGRDVVSCLPNDYLKIKSMRLDTQEPLEIQTTLETEVAQRFGLNAAEDELRYMVAGNVYQGEEIKNEVIFFGIQREKLLAHIEMLEAAGLVPAAIDTVPCALFRSFQSTLRRREDQDIVSVFANLGSRYTTVLIGKGQEITFIKQIPTGGEHLDRQVAEKLGIELDSAVELRTRLRDPDGAPVDAQTQRAVVDAMSSSIEDLAHEISLCFKYYAVTFRGRRPSEAVFAGGEAYESALIDALGRHLGVEIKIAEPLRGFDLSRAHFNRRRSPELCEWAIAVGVALKGMELGVNVCQEEAAAV